MCACLSHRQRPPSVARNGFALPSARSKCRWTYGRIPVTISIGLASGAEGGSLDELIARADKGLLMAKSTGRNKVVTDEELAAFDPDERVQRIRRTSRF